jgi:hypothetical protein
MAERLAVDERTIPGGRIVEFACAPGVDKEDTVPARHRAFFDHDVVIREPANRVQAGFKWVAIARLAIDEKVLQAENEVLGSDG